MQKKKLLFLMQWYPARDSANVLCDINIIKSLVSTGRFDITVLCYQHPDQSSFENIDNLSVYRFKRSFFWGMLQKYKYVDSSIIYRILNVLNILLMRIKQVLFIPIYPIYEPLLVYKYYKNACKINKENRFDIVVAEHHGLDTLLAGYLLKRKFMKIKYLPIFWDSLSGGFCPKYLPEKFSRNAKIKLEKKIMSLADKAIIMESSLQFHKEKTSHLGYYNKMVALNIPYLIRFPELNHVERQNNRLKFVFAGTLSQRDPAYIINLLSNLQLDLDIIFICSKEYHPKLNLLSAKYNIKIIIKDFMPHHILQKELSKADIFFNIGVREPNAISGKIFEYMSYGKPIISTYFIDNEACIPFLTKYPVALLLDERLSIKNNLRQLKMFLDLKIGRRVSFDEVAELYSSCLPEKYVEVIDSIVNDNYRCNKLK